MKHNKHRQQEVKKEGIHYPWAICSHEVNVCFYFAGAILIFLPGYDDIVSLRDKINDEKQFADGNK